MQLYHLNVLPWFLALAAACPCTFKDEPLNAGEVTCEAGTQDMLPFSLPPCLSESVGNDMVQRLILTDQNFPHLVPGSFLLFPNLVHLDLSYCSIEQVDQFIFEENPKLKSLILTRNLLTTIPALFQSSVNSLQSLTIRHNKLESLEATNLNNLVVLDLDDNSMTEDGVSPMMAFLPNIYEVSLDSNLISRIDNAMFAQQEQIEIISLWNNKITYIQPGSFDHLLKIQSIDLKSNSLTEYRTESWHFCHSLNQETLNVKLDDFKLVTQDLKVDAFTASYCAIALNSEPTVSTSCSNEEGHLSCSGKIEDLVCELKDMDFKSITFLFQKDANQVKVDNFFEAESNSYFKEINQINGKSNMTKYLSDLKLYGTKFDLATLDEHVGPRTETVTIFADTVHMSRPLESPIKSKIYVRARVVSISEDISMNMTKQQFFQHLETDQPVDNWASVQEVISDVGNATFSVRKLGFIEVQQALNVDSVSATSKGCSPRIFSVHEYEIEHHTHPSVFFDRVQMNLLRMAVRTLASTRSNDALTLNMADHTLAKTTDSEIVEDKKAYIVAQKLIRDKEILTSHKRNVPFYSTTMMEKLAEVMYDNMGDYARNESDLMLKLDIALGRMTDMNKNFEDARLMRELYFERELQTLEEIWNSTDTAWHWSFDASRNMESSIQDSIQKNGEEMFQMEKNELEEILARAQDTVKSDQAVVDMYKGEIDRYSVEAQLSLALQRQKLDETNKAGDNVKAAKQDFDDSIQKWKEEQMRKAFFGFLKAFFGVMLGIFTMQPEIAGASIAAGAAEAGAAGAEIAEIMGAIEQLIAALADLEDMLDSISGVGDIDVSIPDFGSDIALGTAVGWRGALENAYYMKNMTTKFHDIEILGQTKVGSVGPATDYGVDPAGLQQALSTYNDRGSQLISETVNFAQLMMHLADLAGELQVAEEDLEIAIEQVERAKQMLDELAAQHDEYVDWMNEHRDDYQNKCDEFQDAYNTASEATKEEFKKQIIELFEKFKQAFEEANIQYVTKMNELTGALYTKVASVKQHSMVQRSLIMNLYQDFCDGLFYFSFTECDKNKAVPTMSEDFGHLLQKLNDIRWDSITSWENLPNAPENFHDVTIKLMDQRAAGFNSSAQLFGPVTSLRNAHEAYFNFKEHDNYLDQSSFYRIRLDTIRIHLLDQEGNLIPAPSNDPIKFSVYLPLEFNDTDALKTVHSFRAMKKVCAADYFTKDGVITQMSKCEVVQEFEGVNHKTSHDGVFRIVARNMEQELLDQVGAIKIIVSGNYVTRGKGA